MTTVAWDGRSLAADSQITSEFKTTGHSKFFRFRDGSIGAFAGTWANVQAAQRFLDHQVDECPTTEWTAIVMRPGGRVDVLECDGSVLDITTIPYALGSGQAYALAAMACGKTAQEAVYVAASFDPYTGGPIEEHRLSDVVAPVVPKRKATTRK